MWKYYNLKLVNFAAPWLNKGLVDPLVKSNFWKVGIKNSLFNNFYQNYMRSTFTLLKKQWKWIYQTKNLFFTSTKTQFPKKQQHKSLTYKTTILYPPL